MAGYRRAVLQRSIRRTGELMSRPPSLIILLVLLFTASAEAKDEPRKILIADPYIELHSGPGRGYPIFHVVERGREVYIIKRRTDSLQSPPEPGVQGSDPRAPL